MTLDLKDVLCMCGSRQRMLANGRKAVGKQPVLKKKKKTVGDLHISAVFSSIITHEFLQLTPEPAAPELQLSSSALIRWGHTSAKGVRF